MAIANSDGSIVLTTRIDESGAIAGAKNLKKSISGVTTSLNESEKAAKKFGEQAQKSGSTAKSAFESVAAGIKVMLVVLATKAINAISQFSKQASNLAINAESSVQRLIDIYGSASEALGNFIDQNAKALGMSKSAAASYASVYGNLFSVWADQKTNASLTSQYLQMTAIVASKTGRTVEDVQERIRSGLLGNTEAIEDLGIFVNVKTIEMTDAFQRMANGKSWEQLDAYTQQQIRSMAILEQATAKYGTEVANTSASTRNRFKAAYEEFQTTWGKIMSTVLVPILEALTKILNVATEVLQGLANISKKTVNLPEDMEKVAENTEDLNKELDKTDKTLNKIGKSLAGFDEIDILSANNNLQENLGLGNIVVPEIDTSNIEEQTSQTSNKIVEIIKSFVKDIGKELNPMVKALKDFYNKVLKPFIEITTKNLTPLSFEGFKKIIGIVSTIITEVVDVLQGLWVEMQPYVEKIQAKIDGFVAWLNDKLGDIQKEFKDFNWEDLETDLIAIWNAIAPVVDFISDLLNEISKFATSQALGDLKIILRDLGDILGVIAGVINGDFSKAWKHLTELLGDNRVMEFKERFDSTVELLKGFAEGVMGFFQDDGTSKENFFENFSKGVVKWWDEKVVTWWDEKVAGVWTSFWDNFKTKGKTAIVNILNFLIEKINAIIDDINNIKPLYALLTGDILGGVPIPHIPSLASGQTLPVSPFKSTGGESNTSNPIGETVNEPMTVREEHYYIGENEVIRILHKLLQQGEHMNGNDLLYTGG